MMLASMAASKAEIFFLIAAVALTVVVAAIFTTAIVWSVRNDRAAAAPEHDPTNEREGAE